MWDFLEWVESIDPDETPFLTRLTKLGYGEEPDHGYTRSPHPHLLNIVRFVELPRLFGGVIARWSPQPIWSAEQLARRRQSRTVTWGTHDVPKPEAS